MARIRKPVTSALADDELHLLQGLLSGSPRQTLPINANVLGALPWYFLPRRQYQSLDLTTIVPGSVSPQQLIDILSDADPHIALAVWNFLRLCSAQWSYEVRTPDNTESDPVAKATLDVIISKMNDRWGGIDNLVTQWTMSIILEGACAGETIPNETITDVEDMVAVSPWTIYFQRDLAQRYVAYQWQPMLASGGMAWNGTPKTDILTEMQALQHGGFRQLNELTFAYIPLDTAIDDPYGRMPFASVLQIIVFDAQILKDLRQWSHINAFGRLDVSILAEKVQALMPPNVQQNAALRQQWYQQYVADVQSAYNSLNPDDTFIHFDNVVVSGVNSAGQTFDIDNLIRIVERRMFRSLKQLPILMGSNEGTTETWGTLQMEVYALGIASIQRVVAALMERLFTVALRIRGFGSIAHVTFERVHSNDRLQAAQAQAIEIKNAAAQRDQGWITQDEAAIVISGSGAVANAPNPDPLVAIGQPDSAPDAEHPTESAPFVAPAPQQMIRGMPDDGVRKQPHTKAAYTHRLRRRLARYFRSVKLHKKKLTAIIDMVTPAIMAESDTQRMQKDARKSLIETIANLLRELIPDTDPALADILETFRLEGWNQAAQEALNAIGLSGVMHLTNAQLLSKLKAYVEARAEQLQQATRNYVAQTIFATVQQNRPTNSIIDAVLAQLLAMGDDRAATIAETETNSVWNAAAQDTWSQNGVPFKVWATDDDPDPNAGSGPTPCRDNAYASPIAMNDTFPSGDDAPPAHANCRCWLRPSGDPSETAQANPWTGE